MNKLIRVVSILMAAVLTARAGRIQYGNHIETWYDRPMGRVVARAQSMGIPCEYWVRKDGVKMFGHWVIVAADPSVTRYTIVETSLGQGIVLDTHTAGDPNLYDIATDWK